MAAERNRRASRAEPHEAPGFKSFDTPLEAKVLVEDWRIDHNGNRPHSAHGDLTPNEFAEAWIN
jgi:hypothetical protein